MQSTSGLFVQGVSVLLAETLISLNNVEAFIRGTDRLGDLTHDVGSLNF